MARAAGSPTRAREQLLGTGFAAAGALSYGVTIAFGRSLARRGLGAPTVLGIRFGVGSLLLLAVLAATRRPPLPVTGERARCVALGLVYAFESTLFFMALERGSAAAVALLFYSYPVIVTLLETTVGGRRASRRVALALALSATGTAVVVVAGGRVSITTVGMVLALGSAASFSLYLFASHRLVVRTDAPTIAAWVALACGTAHLLRGIATGTLRSPSGQWPALVGNGVATAAAFSFMFAGLRLLGPTRTSVVMTLEAFFAIVLAAAFLAEPLDAVQVLGGAVILAGAVIVSRTPADPVDTAEPP